MTTPAFAGAEYEDPPRTGLEVQDPGGGWVGATAYTHTTRGNVVLWYGGDAYEGLGGGYRWSPLPRPTAAAPLLLGGDGTAVPMRWAQGEGQDKDDEDVVWPVESIVAQRGADIRATLRTRHGGAHRRTLPATSTAIFRCACVCAHARARARVCVRE